MTGHRSEGAGYGALECSQELAGGGAHTSALPFDASRSRGRLVAVGSALVASLVAVAALALATSQIPGGKRDLADAFPAASTGPSVLLSGSGLKPRVEPFPNIRYNVFDPKEFPEPPHHRSVGPVTPCIRGVCRPHFDCC